MIPGASAAAWGRQVGRLRWWQHLVAAVGVQTPEMRRKARHVKRCNAGRIGEQRTAKLLRPLTGEGWHILHDRALPTGKANVDHVLISPAGALLVLDSKMWRRDWPVRLEGGQLMRGPRDETGEAEKAEAIAGRAAAALGLSTKPTCLLVVHNAPVAKGGFHVGDVSVVPAGRLLELLRHNAVGRPNPREPHCLRAVGLFRAFTARGAVRRGRRCAWRRGPSGRYGPGSWSPSRGGCRPARRSCRPGTGGRR